MSSAIVLIVISFILQSIQATFPPPENAPPIPAQANRPWDISEQRVYIQDDTQPSLPHNVIKNTGFFPSDPKIDGQPWFVPENQSGEKSDFTTSTERFSGYYENGSPAVGPVATPLPDDTYVAQPASSSASKILPNPSENVGSDIWVLTKGPNDQYIPERWVQVQVADDRIVDANQDINPKFVSESVKVIPQQPITIKNSELPVPSMKSQQIWIRAPPPIHPQKIIQNAPSYVKELPVDVPQPVVKQYVQTQMVKETQPLPPPPVILPKQTSGFVVPPPPPPPYKGVDISPPQQTVLVNGITAVSGDKSGGIPVAKNSLLGQVKHIWIPTSQQSGKFITVPVGTVVDNGKLISAKGTPMDIPQPVSVSDTWILRQDGPIPRFEQQKSIAGQIIQNGNVFVAETPVLQLDSPKNPPLLDKTVDVAVSGDIWPARKGFVDTKSAAKSEIQQPVFPPSAIKLDPVVAGKTISTQPDFPQKTYFSAPTVLQSPPLPALPQLAPVIKGKPCPIGPQKSLVSPKSIPFPAYRSIASINRQPYARIIRLNRYPYGSYYVLNPRMGPSLYTYPRLQAPVLQRTRNGLVRLVATRPIGIPLPMRQVAIQVPKRQAAVPITATKSVAPILQPQMLYPSVQAVNRLRYAYPWGYLRSLPVVGRNIFALPTLKSAKLEVLTSSSSESSSSESSSSESKSSEKKSKKTKKSEELQNVSNSGGDVTTIESEEPEPANQPEKESEVEQDVSESAPEETETKEEVPTETETKESAEVAESQLHPKFINPPLDDLGKEKFENLDKPYFSRFENRDRSSTVLPHIDISNFSGRYDSRNSIFQKRIYFSSNDGYMTPFIGNNPGPIRHGNEDPSLEASIPARSTTKEPKDIIIS